MTRTDLSQVPRPQAVAERTLSPADALRSPAGGQGPYDVVFVRNLRAWTLIGIHPHERETRQEVRIDAWIGTDTRAAAATDDIDLAIDYAAVSRAFREHAGGAAHRLVETLAEDLAKIALERFGAGAIRVTVEKPGAVPGSDAVGVTIERHATPVRASTVESDGQNQETEADDPSTDPLS